MIQHSDPKHRTRILGIETSCDETSASVVDFENGIYTLRSLRILSQDVHALFGGVVPEIASRQHLTALPGVTRSALEEANCSISDCDAIAVTNAPGLSGALLTGVHYAKGLGLAAGVPVVPVHHLEGHIFATALEHPDAVPPFTALLVSGGHTLLLDVPEWGSYRLLGRTRDDAAGEAFDKVAKLLGLPYPGGRPLEQLSLSGTPGRFNFSRPMLNRGQQIGDKDYFDFSFSGLKTAVLLAVRAEEKSGAIENTGADIAHAFQECVIDTLTAKTFRALSLMKRKRVVLGGGVACNSALQRAMRAEAKKTGSGISVFSPSPRLATDNAAMIAAAGAFRFLSGEKWPADFSAHASMPIPGIIRDNQTVVSQA